MSRQQRSKEWSKLFNKHFAFKSPSDHPSEKQNYECKESFPDQSRAFINKVRGRLAEMKDELNFTKSLLNDYDIKKWNEHTNFTNLCANLSRVCKQKLNAELCTKAWLKFCTILHSYELIQEKHVQSEQTFTSVHLCEAPGAFITCLNHHLLTKFPEIKWNWVATTLNSFYDGNVRGNMIDDDRFIKTTLSNWRFGEDFTGDIMNPRNLDELTKECKEFENVALVTADGSIDCFDDPCMQECHVAPLLYWEVITAINIMAVGASLVIKVFTILEEFTVSVIYLMWHAFSEVNFIKPGPSKPGNSEVYIVCRGFHGLAALGQQFFDLAMQRTKQPDFKTPLIPIDSVEEEFLSKLIECEEFFIHHQIHAINENIETFGRITKNEQHKKYMIKGKISKQFIDYFDLKRLDDNNRISRACGKQPVPDYYTGEHSRNFSSGNFYERTEMKKASWIKRIDIDEATEDAVKPSIVWFSNSVGQLTIAEVDGWQPVLGRKFKISRNTQFYSNYHLNTLFQARELETPEGGKGHARQCNHDNSFFFELDLALQQPSFQNVAVLQISEKRESILVGNCEQKSIAEAVKCFKLESSACHSISTNIVSDNDTYEQTGKDGQKNSRSLEEICCNFKDVSQDTDGLCEREISILQSSLQALEKGRLKEEDCTDVLIFLFYKGSSCKGNETSRLALIIVLSMVLSRLQIGGTLIFEVGDFFTNASAGMFYLFSRVFKRIGIFKGTYEPHLPIRALVCEEFQGEDGPLVQYLKKLLTMEIETILSENMDKELIHVLPIHYTFQDDIVQYLRDINKAHIEIELRALKHIHDKGAS